MAKSYEDGFESQNSARNSDSAGLLSSDDENYGFPLQKPRAKYVTLPRVHIAILYTLLLMFTIESAFSVFSRPKDISLGKLFTPAKDVVSYYEREFTWNFWDKGEYMGYPTDEIDQRWSDLYNFGTSGISNEQAKLLHDKTVPVPDSDSQSLVMLDMWHQLHCLNTLRRMMYPERWPEIWQKNEDGTVNYETVEMLHIDHCIDHIRQSLMCWGDITPTSFFFDPKKGNNPSPWGTHMCRNFDAIKDWAVDRRVDYFSMQEKLGTGKPENHDPNEVHPKGSGYGSSHDGNMEHAHGNGGSGRGHVHVE